MGWLLPMVVAGAVARRSRTLRQDIRNARLWACREMKANNQLREELATANELNDLLMQRCREVVALNITYERQLKGTTR